MIFSCTGVDRNKRDMYSSSIAEKGYIESSFFVVLECLAIADVTPARCGEILKLSAPKLVQSNY
jgi:hypothetical protein